MAITAYSDHVCLWINFCISAKLAYGCHMVHFNKSFPVVAIRLFKIEFTYNALCSVNCNCLGAESGISFVVTCISLTLLSFKMFIFEF